MGHKLVLKLKIVQVVEQKLKTLLIKMDLSRICYSIYYWHYCWWWRGSSSSSSTRELSPKEDALKNTVLDYDWSKGGFDSVMLVDFKIKNNSKYDIKDITVECEHYSNSKTKIDSNSRVIYEIVKAGETKTVKQFNMGFIHSQAASSGCGITDLVVIQ